MKPVWLRGWLLRTTAFLRDRTALDPRSLGALRIGLAIVILADLADRIPDLGAHYSDGGVLPRSVAGSAPWPFVLYFLDGGAWLPGLLFGLTAGAAILMLVGYRTRLSTLLCWYLVRCLQERNELLLHAGDLMLRQLLFWSILLPLGLCWSLDARRRAGRQLQRRPVAGAAAAALVVQLALVYVDTALRKVGQPSWTTGLGVYNALSADYMVTGIGRLLYPHWLLLQLLTYLTLALELIGPQLLFVRGPGLHFRSLVVFTFVFFHLGLGLTLHLGIFPYVCMVAWAAMLPTSFWDTLHSRLSRFVRSRPAVAAASAAPPDAAFGRAWLGGVAAVALGYLMIATTILGARGQDKPPESSWFFAPSRLLGFKYNWEMFVRPWTFSETVLAVATTPGQTEVPVLAVGELGVEQTISVRRANSRWRKYLFRVLDRRQERIPLFLAFACRNWDTVPGLGQPVAGVQLVYKRRRIGLQYAHGDSRTTLLGARACQM